jgi:hypothetical protein
MQNYDPAVHPVTSRCRVRCGFAVHYPQELAPAAEAVLVEHERTHLAVTDPAWIERERRIVSEA